MKKIFLLICVVLSALTATQAQKKIKGNNDLKSEIRQTAAYDKIKLIGSPDVEIVEGTPGQLKITADSNIIPFVETKVENNELIINLKANHNYTFKKGIKILVPAQNVSAISLIGSGDITASKTITTKNLAIKLKGSGDIDLEVNNEMVLAEVLGSGDLSLKGNTQKFTASVKGSGDISASHLKTKNSELNVNGSGDISAHAAEQVTATVIGSGDIQVTGNPKTKNQNVKGSGSININ